MTGKNTLFKIIAYAVLSVLSIAFVVKFGSPQLLKFYVRSGIGDCKKIPIFCMSPTETLSVSDLKTSEGLELVPYSAHKISAFVPKNFNVVQELLIRSSFKKYKRMYKGNVIYMLCEDKDFFARLYPQLKKSGVNDNYEFLRRVMYANEDSIKSITDTFFVIMKGIFIPDIGNQLNAKMILINLDGFRGFINYNMDKSGNYFDCNVVDQEGVFFKVYIKDKDKALDLEKALNIISTLKCKG